MDAVEYRPFAGIAVGLVMAYIIAVALLEGPLKSYVPTCDQILLGFCYDHK